MRALVAGAIVFCLIGLFPAAGADLLLPPRLVVEHDAGVNLIWVELVTGDGESVRRLIRSTSAASSSVATGWSPGGAAAFARWSEGQEPWSAYSRDGGKTWSKARPLKVDLRLRDGATSPGQSMPAAPARLSLPADGRLYLVQFRTVSLPEWRAALEGLGGEVLNHIPHNAHLVRLDPSLIPEVASMDIVERVEPYHPFYRLEPELRDWIDGAPAAGETSEGELRVRVLASEWGPAGKARIAAAAEASGARVAASWPSGHIVELWVSRNELRKVAADDDVVWVDEAGGRSDDLDLVRQDTGTDWLDATLGYCGQGVRAEVLDSGIETHMDHDGIMFHGPHDFTAHGVKTYGIVFGNGDRDGDGDAQARGHLSCAEQGIFADYDFMTDRFAHTQEIKGAPYFASFQTNAWGSDPLKKTYTSLSAEMDDIIWRLDIAITQSQSNAGSTRSRPEAWAKNIIAVGGIKHWNSLSTSDDAWAKGASIGPASDGRIKPDLSHWYDAVFTTTEGNGYTSQFTGTSASVSTVAGVMGLMLQMWSDNLWNTNPVGSTVFERQPHFGTIKALLVNNAKQYPFSGTKHDLTRTHQGWGRPNVQVAHERAPTSFIVDQDTPLEVGALATYDLVVSPGESELKATMVYPDPPAVPGAEIHRVNDVNLEVTSPSGTVYHGNVGLDAGTESTSGGSPNGIDTVENVFIVNPEAGTWTVKVEAAEVNQDAHLGTPQADVTFALVVTGASAAGCGNAVCDPGEDRTTCPLDCAVCGDGFCDDPPENPASCVADCPPVCGDASCDPPEDRISCAVDCAVCGDSFCDSPPEDRTSCGVDCAVCGDTFCDPPEDRTSCATDCAVCGDTFCDPPEDRTTCADDCAVCGDTFCDSPPEDPASCSTDCPPVCGDSSCDPPEDRTTCSTDCAVCGDTFCDNPPEDRTSCATDCAVCGDSFCDDPPENSTSCLEDCPPVCGDGNCDAGEDRTSCAEDCAVCGDSFCDDPPEDRTTCATDCAVCGDGFCDDPPESSASCPSDCETCWPAGTPCSSNHECCSNLCKGKGGNKTCRP
jgi:hypothetical protein